jgi:hypothetical protein
MIDIFHEVKTVVPMLELLNNYGIKVDTQNRFMCWLHPDGKNPSCRVFPQTDSFCCYQCGAGGDVIRFIELYEGLSPMEAVNQLASDYGIETTTFQSSEKSKSDAVTVSALNAWCVRACKILHTAWLRTFDDMEIYAPKNESDELHPRFIVACHSQDYLLYLLEELERASFSEKLSFFKEVSKEVNMFEKYNQGTSGENARSIRPAIA